MFSFILTDLYLKNKQEYFISMDVTIHVIQGCLLIHGDLVVQLSNFVSERSQLAYYKALQGK